MDDPIPYSDLVTWLYPEGEDDTPLGRLAMSVERLRNVIDMLPDDTEPGVASSDSAPSPKQLTAEETFRTHVIGKKFVMDADAPMKEWVSNKALFAAFEPYNTFGIKYLGPAAFSVHMNKWFQAELEDGSLLQTEQRPVDTWDKTVWEPGKGVGNYCIHWSFRDAQGGPRWLAPGQLTPEEMFKKHVLGKIFVMDSTASLRKWVSNRDLHAAFKPYNHTNIPLRGGRCFSTHMSEWFKAELESGALVRRSYFNDAIRWSLVRPRRGEARRVSVD